VRPATKRQDDLFPSTLLPLSKIKRNSNAKPVTFRGIDGGFANQRSLYRASKKAMIDSTSQTLNTDSAEANNGIDRSLRCLNKTTVISCEKTTRQIIRNTMFFPFVAARLNE